MHPPIVLARNQCAFRGYVVSDVHSHRHCDPVRNLKSRCGFYRVTEAVAVIEDIPDPSVELVFLYVASLDAERGSNIFLENSFVRSKQRKIGRQTIERDLPVDRM